MGPGVEGIWSSSISNDFVDRYAAPVRDSILIALSFSLLTRLDRLFVHRVELGGECGPVTGFMS
jgi:hypothetical protein